MGRAANVSRFACFSFLQRAPATSRGAREEPTSVHVRGGGRRYSIFDIRFSIFNHRCPRVARAMRVASIFDIRVSIFNRYIYGENLVTFVWEYCTHQLIVLGVTDFFLILLWWLEPQAPTDHLHEELLFPVFEAPLGIVMQVCVPAASHAPPLGVQAWGTNLSPFVEPRRRVCVFVPPRFGPANALRRIDCPLTCSAGDLRLCVYLHSCRNLGDLL